MTKWIPVEERLPELGKHKTSVNSELGSFVGTIEFKKQGWDYSSLEVNWEGLYLPDGKPTQLEVTHWTDL